MRSYTRLFIFILLILLNSYTSFAKNDSSCEQFLLGAPYLESFLREFESELQELENKNILKLKDITKENLFSARSYKEGSEEFFVVHTDEQMIYFTKTSGQLDIKNNTRFGTLQGKGLAHIAGLEQANYLLHTGDVIRVFPARRSLHLEGDQFGPFVVQDILANESLSTEQRKFISLYKEELQEIIDSKKDIDDQLLFFNREDIVTAEFFTAVDSSQLDKAFTMAFLDGHPVFLTKNPKAFDFTEGANWGFIENPNLRFTGPLSKTFYLENGTMIKINSHHPVMIIPTEIGGPNAVKLLLEKEKLAQLLKPSQLTEAMGLPLSQFNNFAQPELDEFRLEFIEKYQDELQEMLNSTVIYGPELLEADLYLATDLRKANQPPVYVLVSQSDIFYFVEKPGQLDPQNKTKRWGQFTENRSIGFQSFPTQKLRLSEDLVLERLTNGMSQFYYEKSGEALVEKEATFEQQVENFTSPNSKTGTLTKLLFNEFPTEIKEAMSKHKLSLDYISKAEIGFGKVKNTQETLFVLPTEHRVLYFSKDLKFNQSNRWGELRDLSQDQVGNEILFDDGTSLRIQSTIGFTQNGVTYKQIQPSAKDHENMIHSMTMTLLQNSETLNDTQKLALNEAHFLAQEFLKEYIKSHDQNVMQQRIGAIIQRLTLDDAFSAEEAQKLYQEGLFDRMNFASPRD